MSREEIKLKCYVVWIENFFRDGSDYRKTFVAASAGKAKYKFWWEGTDGGDQPFFDWLKCMKVKCLGPLNPVNVFQDEERFNETKRKRNIEFAQLGMKVDVTGKTGVIIGSNSSANLNVLFDGEDDYQNVHPYWEITYYDKKGNIIKCFKESKATTP